nr:TIGR03936 family radical SAM-associated protein [bacterium]
SKERANERLSTIPGMYIPERHPGSQHPDPIPKIEKQFLHDLELAPHPDPQIVPVCRPVHERVVVECARGCPRTCRFCQARIYYSPVRRRTTDSVKTIALKNLRQTGYEEVSLLSLNIADYPGIEPLLMDLMPALQQQNVSISLPSLRPEKLTAPMIEQIRKVRKTGFTLAPEAGSDRLRRVIGKPYDRSRLLDSVRAVFETGWNGIKLYFMIGLPFETDEDVRGIVRLIHDILKIGNIVAGRRISLNISAGIFVPKPHTPFQWVGQASREDILRRQRILRLGCTHPAIKLSLSDLFTSRLEAYFARGDRKASEILIRAFQAGCRMDGWNETLNRDAWIRAFEASGIDLDAAVQTGYPADDMPLPWSFIDSGVSEDSLRIDYAKAVEWSMEPILEAEVPIETFPVTRMLATAGPPERDTPVFHRYLGIFQVLSEFRLFSHMEITMAIARAMRRAGLPLAYSLGYNPHPKITVMNPAPLGFERWFEPMVFDLTESLDGPLIQDELNRELPCELAFHRVATAGSGKPLKPLERYAIALKNSPEIEKRCAIDSIADIVDFLDPAEFGQEIESRFQNSCMDVLCVFNKEGRQDVTLRDVLYHVYGADGMPLDQVLGVRIGWLPASENRIFGLPDGKQSV